MTGIFKAYDMRGTVPEQINENIAINIGKAFGTFRNNRVAKIYVGGDSRESTKEIKKAFIDGLLSTGCNVVDVGTATTPLMIFCAGNYDSVAVNVTASHNPKNYNGFKFFDLGGVPIGYEDGLKNVENIFRRSDFVEGEGKLEVFNPREEYTTHLIGSLGLTGVGLKIVVDCMNGSGSSIDPFVLEKLGAEVLKIRCDGSGDFPDSGPNPSEKNLDELKIKVIETGADLGLAFDGDGDRLAVVDNTGKFVEPKHIFSLLIKNTGLDANNFNVVRDIVSSNAVDDVAKMSGGNAIICRVGHTYIAQKSMETESLLSGELSGHYYFKETFYGDDALFAGMKLIQYLVRQRKKLSECLEGLPVYFSNAFYTKVNDDAQKIINQLKNKFTEEYGEIDTMDGVKVNFENGWMLFRASHTEPKILIVYESKNKDELEKIEAIVNKNLDGIRI
jgi:phosphomannomutase / phosphoglucomutase